MRDMTFKSNFKTHISLSFKSCCCSANLPSYSLLDSILRRSLSFRWLGLLFLSFSGIVQRCRIRRSCDSLWCSSVEIQGSFCQSILCSVLKLDIFLNKLDLLGRWYLHQVEHLSNTALAWCEYFRSVYFIVEHALLNVCSLACNCALK